MGWMDSFFGKGGGTNWASIVGGVISGYATYYAANQQKKMQEQQYKQQQQQYQDQLAFQQQQLQAARSTPAALMAPYLMETLIKAYGGKLSKYGIDLPVEQMLGALSGSGNQQAQSGPQYDIRTMATYGGGSGGAGGRGRVFHRSQEPEFSDIGSMNMGGGPEWYESSRGLAEAMGMDFGRFDSARNGDGFSLAELAGRYDALPNYQQALFGMANNPLGPLGTALDAAGWMIDRGWFDNSIYGGQLLQPLKENPNSWWNKGDITGTIMDFENAALLDPNQFFGTYTSWGR